MDKGLEARLTHCLDLLEQGESVEQILGRYPDEAEQLRPLLATAAKLEEFKLNPSLVAQNKSKEAFLAQADALRTGSRPRFSAFFRLPRLVMPLVALVLIFLLGAGLNTVSATATPGEPLYTAKRLFESLQLALTTETVSKSDLMARFNRERIREIQQLLDEGRNAGIEFEGIVEDIESDFWTIAGLETRVNDETQFEGAARTGDLVAVRGRTLSGELVAEVITLLSADAQPSPIVTPTITPAVSPTPTPTPVVEVDVPQSPSPTATDTPEPSDTPTATVTSTDTPSPTSTSTASPSPSATVAPTSNDNGTDDGNDNSNDNDDDEEEHENENENDSGGSNENENSNDDD